MTGTSKPANFTFVIWFCKDLPCPNQIDQEPVFLRLIAEEKDCEWNARRMKRRTGMLFRDPVAVYQITLIAWCVYRQPLGVWNYKLRFGRFAPSAGAKPQRISNIWGIITFIFLFISFCFISNFWGVIILIFVSFYFILVFIYNCNHIYLISGGY